VRFAHPQAGTPQVIRLLVTVGVRELGFDLPPAAVGRPRPTRGAPPPFQPDDLIDFHQLLAADDWFDQLMAVEHRARVGD
jgi:hypothetical protein